MRPASLIVACAIACVPAVASADVELEGWTDDGRFVVEISNNTGGWDADWMAAVESDDFWGVCTPQRLDDAAEYGDGACQLCRDAASCGLTVDAAKTKASKKSPDKKIKVKDRRRCVKDREAHGGKTCTRTIAFGKAGSLAYEESWSGDKAPLTVYFRPDSKAALVVFEASGWTDVSWSAMYVVDLSASR